MKRLLFLFFFLASVCSAQINNNNNGSGGGGGTLPGIYINGGDYLVSDAVHGQIITDGSWSNSSSTLNSAGMAQWTSAIIGDVVFATNGCRTGISPAGLDLEGVIVALGTVLTVPSSTQITVSTTSTAAQASAGCIIIGQRQDTGMTAISTAVNAFKQTCPTVNLPSGIFLISAIPTFLSAQPTACTSNGLVQGQEPGGLGGFLVRGQGGNSTVISILPDLLPTACTNGTGSNACFVIPAGATWRDFRITGNGNGMNGRSDAKSAVQVGAYGAFDHMIFDQWGTGDSPTFTGVTILGGGGVSWITESLIDSFGNLGLEQDGNGNTYLRNDTIQNVCGASQVGMNGSGPYMVSEGGVIVQLPSAGLCSTSPNRNAISVAGGSVWQSGPGDVTQMGNGGANSNAISVDATSFAFLNNGGFYNSLNGAGESTLKNLGTVWAGGAEVFFTATGTSSPAAILNSGASAKLFENAIIRIPAGIITNTGGAQWFGSTSATGTTLVAGNLVPSANFGTGAAISVPLGNSQNFTFTLTNGSASVGANPTIAFTFPKAFLVAPTRCSLWQVGGTQAITATTEFLAPSAYSATGVTFTYNGTPTINLTEFYQGNCGN